MKDLSTSVSDLRKKYREIFKISSDEILKRINALKPEIDGDIFDVFEENSKWKKWQADVLEMLEKDISKEIY